ncbi:MAG TPA: outer membrane protein assembly factor BamD, partial [Myxococcota bacterium]|nr:outer membrane protein assembly factor BamD [Myxococcota bacterium]
AREHLAACRRKLADHEMYVARFYFARQRWRAAAGRAEGLLQEYHGLGLDAEALWLLARADEASGDRAAAAKALGVLVQDYPGSPEAAPARQMLDGLGTTPPPAATGTKATTHSDT